MDKKFEGIDKALKDGCSLVIISQSFVDRTRDIRLRDEKRSLVIAVGGPDLVTALNGASEIYLMGEKDVYTKSGLSGNKPVDRVDGWIFQHQEVYGEFKDGKVKLDAVSINTDEKVASAEGPTFQEAYSKLDSALLNK